MAVIAVGPAEAKAPLEVCGAWSYPATVAP